MDNHLVCNLFSTGGWNISTICPFIKNKSKDTVAYAIPR